MLQGLPAGGATPHSTKNLDEDPSAMPLPLYLSATGASRRLRCFDLFPAGLASGGPRLDDIPQHWASVVQRRRCPRQRGAPAIDCEGSFVWSEGMCQGRRRRNGALLVETRHFSRPPASLAAPCGMRVGRQQPQHGRCWQRCRTQPCRPLAWWPGHSQTPWAAFNHCCQGTVCTCFGNQPQSGRGSHGLGPARQRRRPLSLSRRVHARHPGTVMGRRPQVRHCRIQRGAMPRRVRKALSAESSIYTHRPLGRR